MSLSGMYDNYLLTFNQSMKECKPSFIQLKEAAIPSTGGLYPISIIRPSRDLQPSATQEDGIQAIMINYSKIASPLFIKGLIEISPDFWKVMNSISPIGTYA